MLDLELPTFSILTPYDSPGPEEAIDPIMLGGIVVKSATRIVDPSTGLDREEALSVIDVVRKVGRCRK